MAQSSSRRIDERSTEKSSGVDHLATGGTPGSYSRQGRCVLLGNWAERPGLAAMLDCLDASSRSIRPNMPQDACSRGAAAQAGLAFEFSKGQLVQG